MKKLFLILTIVIIIISFIIILKPREQKQFYLENKYYKESKIEEIKTNELEELIKNKESFLVFVYQPMCITSSNLESILNELEKETTLYIYKIPFSSIKESNLGKHVKYYPSFVIYEKGELVDYLKSDKEKHKKYFKDLKEFKSWLTTYVKLKN